MVLKTKLFIFVVLFSLNLFSQNDLTEIKPFGENKGNLKMFHYIPENLDYNKSIPLVVVIHGCTQSANLIASETGWNKLADSLNLIIVYPEQKLINNIAKCYNFYLGYKAKKDKGEVASIKEMIHYTRKNYNIDSSKIFITGFSSGGAISNAMLNAYPKLFNAGALFAAPSTLFNFNKEIPTEQPRVAIIQGDKDMIVPKKNAARILNQWIKKNELSDTTFVLNKDYQNNPLLSSKYFYTPQKVLKIIIIAAEDVKHKLMIVPGEPISRGGKMDFYTTDINFHSTYWVTRFFGLVKE
ncbi:MAG: hypothetical protein COB15_13980 [Flavobacteriales bacterium]|nr:MAG: hypothetical protein COB15_13980 [Flavobacteriales bacterium]